MTAVKILIIKFYIYKSQKPKTLINLVSTKKDQPFYPKITYKSKNMNK